MKLFADNLVRVEEKEMTKYTKLKEGSDIDPGDLLHIFDDIYAIIGEGNIVCKSKVTKFNIVLRKK
jgi:hypothetical protein